MSDDERENPADELAFRWLSVDEVLGRGPRRVGVVSAGEYFAADPVAEDGRSAVPEPGPAAAGLAGAEAPSADEACPDPVATQGAEPWFDLVAADTDAASRYFKEGAAPGKLAGRTMLLPFVAVAELATWPERLLWGHARTEELCEWLDSGRMIVGDETVSRIWARLTVAGQRAGTALPPNDCWIAAGCLSYGLPLATLNQRRYQHFADRYGLTLI